MTMASNAKWQFTYATSNKAVLRIGPFHLKWSPVSARTALLMGLLSVVIYVLLFVWYVNTSIAHTYPDNHVSMWFGLWHGYFALPSFVVSWFNHDVTIYQSPNDGFWYNLGFLLGIGAFASTARSSN